VEHSSLFEWIWEERERAVQTPDVEDLVLDPVDRDAGVSTRQVGEELLIFQSERTFVGVLFNELLSIHLFHQCCLQMSQVSAEMASSIFTTNTSGQRRILIL
jgi:hypothetical protein